MAWIKLDHFTPDKPEIVQAASILGIDQDSVLGKCIRLWIWADQQSVYGDDLSVTKTFLDRVTCCQGFANAMQKVGWLTSKNGGFSFPNFDRHNGESAKKRAQTANRMEKYRSKSDDPSVTNASPDKIRSEKTREEEENKNPLPPKGEWFSFPFFSDTWNAWEKARKKKAGERQYKQLEKLSNGDMTTAISILSQSADNQWIGLFELKDGNNGTRTGAHRIDRNSREYPEPKLTGKIL